MSRMRVLKPEFFSDSSVVRCSPLARLLFAGSWVFADDNGILPDDMLQLKMQALPGDNADCEELKCEIVGAGLWVPFLAGDRRWILIRSFSRHQSLDRPNPVYPLPDDDTVAELGLAVAEKKYLRHGCEQTVRVLVVDRSSNGRRTFGDGSPRKERKGKEEKGTEISVPESYADSELVCEDGSCPANTEPDTPPRVNAPEAACGERLTRLESEVVEAWNSLPAAFRAVKRVGARRRHLKARLADTWWRENWRVAIARVCSSAGLAGKNDRGWVADFDWFLRPDTVTKLIEGKYDGWGRKEEDDKSWMYVGLEEGKA